mmetsp:Transcript_89909/g.145502  ORF Transcript_89909/g.145502 Transcript_89909/m.145502 type:complete len:232 (-) Transcript_89909:208-903(-)
MLRVKIAHVDNLVELLLHALHLRTRRCQVDLFVVVRYDILQRWVLVVETNLLRGRAAQSAPLARCHIDGLLVEVVCRVKLKRRCDAVCSAGRSLLVLATTLVFDAIGRNSSPHLPTHFTRHNFLVGSQWPHILVVPWLFAFHLMLPPRALPPGKRADTTPTALVAVARARIRGADAMPKVQERMALIPQKWIVPIVLGHIAPRRISVYRCLCVRIAVRPAGLVGAIKSPPN